MEENEFEIIFKHVGKECKAYAVLQTDEVKDALTKSAEVREMIRMINDNSPVIKPITYSGS